MELWNMGKFIDKLSYAVLYVSVIIKLLANNRKVCKWLSTTPALMLKGTNFPYFVFLTYCRLRRNNWKSTATACGFHPRWLVSTPSYSQTTSWGVFLFSHSIHETFDWPLIGRKLGENSHTPAYTRTPAVACTCTLYDWPICTNHTRHLLSK